MSKKQSEVIAFAPRTRGVVLPPISKGEWRALRDGQIQSSTTRFIGLCGNPDGEPDDEDLANAQAIAQVPTFLEAAAVLYLLIKNDLVPDTNQLFTGLERALWCAGVQIPDVTPGFSQQDFMAFRNQEEYEALDKPKAKGGAK
jgi:hypothetical protein